MLIVRKAHQATQVLIDSLFYVFTLMSCRRSDMSFYFIWKPVGLQGK